MAQIKIQTHLLYHLAPCFGGKCLAYLLLFTDSYEVPLIRWTWSTRQLALVTDNGRKYGLDTRWPFGTDKVRRSTRDASFCQQTVKLNYSSIFRSIAFSAIRAVRRCLSLLRFVHGWIPEAFIGNRALQLILTGLGMYSGTTQFEPRAGCFLCCVCFFSDLSDEFQNSSLSL
jgi:hypothetical protein